MRFIRYQRGGEAPRFGWAFEDHVGPIEGSPLGDYRRLEADIPIETVKLLAPVQPGKILAVGRNYVEHAREHGAEVPELPLIFLKPPSSLLDPGGTIELPPQSKQVEHEAELAVVIGRRGRWISAEDSAAYILGYTIANDVTARDLQRKDGQWTRAKGFDTFCPLGPWIETEVDIADVLITCRVNGEMRQMASSREMVFSVPQLIAFASSVMTLEPGDILLTGTPAGVGPLADGDRVEVEIEGIGILVNGVRSALPRF
ncbi:fumarylacetoacetate hydrolase family protein [Levilinea saccharolytica]|uniref:2-hydroxyhepta-2,4-diene-1,7-dioate isomerase n=1 Tax=Levilinea saccharolytica TaxID=229921 RepID=A0A0P6YMD7_9CHLR|nr:fumarylacetoacetate hydrolase family protein [Levilinea saccharolytica]KPL91785.1 2-hydroxyhepta-2,4-diene-1,7-dioate isomerase [Levilinea saccharolytica]GAP17594.1 2-keto-4-pentenoate hydratase/2-oxohepta-3-ene-1,7-dioic acid hydratase [Levilinea saccharolytica]